MPAFFVGFAVFSGRSQTLGTGGFENRIGEIWPAFPLSPPETLATLWVIRNPGFGPLGYEASGSLWMFFLAWFGSVGTHQKQTSASGLWDTKFPFDIDKSGKGAWLHSDFRCSWSKVMPISSSFRAAGLPPADHSATRLESVAAILAVGIRRCRQAANDPADAKPVSENLSNSLPERLESVRPSRLSVSHRVSETTGFETSRDHTDQEVDDAR